MDGFEGDAPSIDSPVCTFEYRDLHLSVDRILKGTEPGSVGLKKKYKAAIRWMLDRLWEQAIL